MYETLIVDGVDLAEVVQCMQSLDGLYSVGTPRGENVVIPGVDGETPVDKPYGAGVIELGLILAGSTTMEFNDRFRTLKKLIRPGKVLNLERRLSYSSGNEAHVTTGEWASGLAPTVSLMRFGRVTLGLRITDGVWYAQTTTTITSAGGSTTLTVDGETRTQRMELVMPAGGTVTNTTNGSWVSNSATGGDVTIQNEEMSAAQGGSTDVSETLSWNGRFPMRLEPGDNVFSGSAFTINYLATYL